MTRLTPEREARIRTMILGIEAWNAGNGCVSPYAAAVCWLMDEIDALRDERDLWEDRARGLAADNR